MPPETAIAPAPTETPAPAETPTAEPVTEAPPTPEVTPEVTPEGGAQPEAEGGQEEKPGLDLSAAEELIAAEVDRRVQEKAEKAEVEAAKRGLQRTKEADDGESARVALYKAAEQGMYDSAATLRKLAQTGEVDEDVLTKHMGPVVAGAQALIARDNETTLKAYMEAVLPDQTDAEKEALEPLLYEFRRNGRFDKLPATVADLALARKDTEISDLKRQLHERTAIRAAAEKLANAAEAAGNGVGAETPKGQATQAGPLTIEEANTLPIDELKRRTQAQ